MLKLDLIATGALTVALCLPAAAWAQEDLPAQPGAVFSLPAPPSGFTPETASDEELARYGLPPRPSAAARGGLAYRTWFKAMHAARVHVEPVLRLDQRRHGPALTVGRPATQAISAASSLNWSGQSLLSTAYYFSPSSYAEVFAQWIVSAVQQPIGSCAGTDVSATWVGIDGIGGSTDVMQAGTEADASCFYGTTTPNYYPWFEWYPAFGYQITNFPVQPGSAVFVVVHATSATAGNVTFVNLANNQYTVAQMAAPAGTALRGNSAEWVVERPTTGSGNTPGTLADFAYVGIWGEVAYLEGQVGGGTYDVPGNPLGGRTGNTITMVDSAHAPLATSGPAGTSAQIISVVGAAK